MKLTGAVVFVSVVVVFAAVARTAPAVPQNPTFEKDVLQAEAPVVHIHAPARIGKRTSTPRPNSPGWSCSAAPSR